MEFSGVSTSLPNGQLVSHECTECFGFHVSLALGFQILCISVSVCHSFQDSAVLEYEHNETSHCAGAAETHVWQWNERTKAVHLLSHAARYDGSFLFVARLKADCVGHPVVVFIFFFLRSIDSPPPHLTPFLYQLSITPVTQMTLWSRECSLVTKKRPPVPQMAGSHFSNSVRETAVWAKHRGNPSNFGTEFDVHTIIHGSQNIFFPNRQRRSGQEKAESTTLRRWRQWWWILRRTSPWNGWRRQCWWGHVRSSWLPRIHGKSRHWRISAGHGFRWDLFEQQQEQVWQCFVSGESWPHAFSYDFPVLRRTGRQWWRLGWRWLGRRAKRPHGAAHVRTCSQSGQRTSTRQRREKNGSREWSPRRVILRKVITLKESQEFDELKCGGHSCSDFHVVQFSLGKMSKGAILGPVTESGTALGSHVCLIVFVTSRISSRQPWLCCLLVTRPELFRLVDGDTPFLHCQLVTRHDHVIVALIYDADQRTCLSSNSISWCCDPCLLYFSDSSSMEESDTSSAEEEDEVDSTVPDMMTVASAAEEPVVKQVSQPLSGNGGTNSECISLRVAS